MSTSDFFRSRLDAMIDLSHPLAVLANRMPWAAVEATLTPMFERRARAGRISAQVDLFRVTPKLPGAGVSAAGRPRLPIRLMVGRLYLKHAYNESDDSVCEGRCLAGTLAALPWRQLALRTHLNRREGAHLSAVRLPDTRDRATAEIIGEFRELYGNQELAILRKPLGEDRQRRGKQDAASAVVDFKLVGQIR